MINTERSCFAPKKVTRSILPLTPNLNQDVMINTERSCFAPEKVTRSVLPLTPNLNQDVMINTERSCFAPKKVTRSLLPPTPSCNEPTVAVSLAMSACLCRFLFLPRLLLPTQRRQLSITLFQFTLRVLMTLRALAVCV